MVSYDVHTIHQLFNHVIGAIISLIVGGVYYLLVFIIKKYILKKQDESWREGAI